MATQVDVLFNARMNVDNAMKGIKEIQQTLGKIQMPKGLESSFEKSFGNLDGLIKKFNDQLNKGVKTKGDVTGLERISNQIENELNRIGADFKKLTGQELKFKIDTTEVKNAREEFRKAVEERDKYAASQASKKLRGAEGKSTNDLLDAVASAAGNNKTKTGQAAIAAKTALNSGDIEEYKKQLAFVEKYFNRLTEGKEKLFKSTNLAPEKVFELLVKSITNSSAKMEELDQKVKQTKADLNTATSNAVEEVGRQAEACATSFGKEDQAIRQTLDSQRQLANQSQSLNQNLGQLESHVAMYFSFAAILRKVTQIARKAFQTVKELDAAMVETAVVTNFDVGDMWDMLPEYTKNANALGSTIKDVYEAATLYYQQGLNQAQAMGLANETLKMARIGGLQAAEATDMMTAALRGFNMQINEMSAQRINDVYSKLAAITASDTRELGSAMERTASIANSAGMAFETTSAFLAQMIETTREAPENLGTAMKTIVARFQEMKNDPTKLIDSEGEMLDANRVDKALKTIGVSLMDTNGQFRNLDEVFLEISQKWDGLSQAQQRYIATIAAGSRQQSRFIAMVQNYDRVMELTQAANNATGASQEQFNKTLEGLDAKLNKLKNAWDQFAMGLANNKIIKVAVDGMTSFFTIINKILGVLDNLPDPFGGLTKSIITFLAVIKGMNFGGKILTGGVQGIGMFAAGDAKTPFGGIQQGISNQFQQARTAKDAAAAKRAALTDARVYRATILEEMGKGNFNFISTMSKNSSTMASKQLVERLFPSGEIDAATKLKATEITNKVISLQGKYGLDDARAAKMLNQQLGKAGIASETTATAKDMEMLRVQAQATERAFAGFGGRIASTGSYLQTFGMILGGPVGSVLTTVGFTLMTVGSSLSKLVTSTVAATAGALAHAAGIKAENRELLKQKILNGEISSQNYGKMFSNLYSKAGGIGGIFKNLGGIFKNVGSMAIKFFTNRVGLALTALAITVGVFYYQWTKLDREMKRAGSAAGEAADAYSSAAQATSELRDNLSQLEEAQAGFDGLVEGTAAFNEQLIKSNELILGLLKKYPMLYDYLTTESNGRMTISDEGMKEVLEYQKNITSQAAALSTVMNGEYQALKSEKEAQDLRRGYLGGLQGLRGEDREEYIKNYEKEQEFLEKQQETYRQTSKATAISTALSGKELKNQEAITQLYSDQYDARKKSVDLSKKEARQIYADFYGYDLRGKKFYDNEGNEVEVDNKDMMAAAENIEVLTTFEADAESLNKTLDYANKYFEDNFNWDPFKGATITGRDNVISDLIGKNSSISEDVIQGLLADSTALEETVSQLSAEQIASIMGVSLDTVSSNLEGYRAKVVKLLEDNAEDIAEAQAQAYADLGILIGKTYNTTSVSAIEKELRKFTQAQREAMLQAAQGLNDAAGENTMKAMITEMSDIYSSDISKNISDMEDLIEDVNWESPIERLTVYNKMIDSSNERISEMGRRLRKSGDESNLLTNSFEEVYDSQDYIEATKDLSKYTDALGHIDASGVRELASESNSLNKLLESGEMTTGGWARTMNLLHDNADLTFMDLNEDVLKLLNNLGQLDTLIGEAHNTIENYDGGIDTGEAGDFLKERAEEFQEFYENQEWGNPQMQAWARFILGEDEFIKQLRDRNGDLKQLYNDYHSILSGFSDGGYSAWQNLANKSNNDRYSINPDGSFHIDLSGIESIDDLIKDIAETAGISEDAAKVYAEVFSNYSPDLQKRFEDMAFVNTFNENGENYISKRTTKNGDVVLLQSELDKFINATGLSLEEVLEKIAEVAGKTVDDLKIVEDTKKGLTTEELAQSYSKAYAGEGAKQNDWIEQYADQETGRIDVKQAVDGLVAAGEDLETAKDLVFTAFQDDKNHDYFYGDERLAPEDITSLESFNTFWDEVEETDKWTAIGVAIADGFSQRLNLDDYFGIEKDESNDSSGSKDTTSSTTSTVDTTPTTANTTPTVNTGTTGPLPSLSGMKAELEVALDPETQQKAREQLEDLKSDAEEDPVIIDFEPNMGFFDEPVNMVLNDLTKKVTYLPIEINSEKLKQEGKTTLEGIQEEIDAQDLDIDIQAVLDRQGIKTDLEATKSEIDATKGTITINGKDNASKAAYAAAVYTESLKPTEIIKGDAGPLHRTALAAFNAWQGKVLDWAINVSVHFPKLSGLLAKAFGFEDVSGKTFSSDITTNLQGADAFIPTTLDDSPGGGGGGGGGGGNNSKPTINNFSIQEIIRYDAEKRLASYQTSLDKLEKTLEKNLEKIGVTTSDISKNINKQRSYLNKEIKDQNKITGTYNKQLKKLDKGGYYEYLSWTDSTGQSHDGSKYNLSNYIKKNKRGVYQIDTNAINATAAKVGGSNANDRRAVREMLYKAAQGALDPLVSGLEDSKKKTQEYKEKLKELDQQVYDAFYAWENELTRIYNINQQIEQVTKRIERVGSYVDLELARVGAGAMGTAKAINNSVQALKRENSSRRTQINLQKQLINGEQERLMTALSDEDERAELKRAQKEGNTARIQAAKDAVTAANLADKYTVVTLNNDSTANINVNWEQLEKDRRSGKITEETYQAIKERIEEMISANADLEDAIKGLNDAYAELYNELIEYRQTIEDMEDTLLKQLEAETKKRIDNAKKLSTAITKALKDILDTVRKRLQERRQKEDNAKTEQDIANKQQRLNLLRANTSGGNKTEIAQLEKEIADAQQSYGRTLEDQLLQKLQDQADEAAKQRERQIQIAEDQLEIQKDINKQIVYEYLLALRNTGTMPAEAMELLKAANNYDEKGIFGSKFSLDRLEQDVTKTGIALREIQASRTGSTAWTIQQAGEVVKGINEINKALGDNDLLTQAVKSYNRKDTPTAARKLIEEAGSKSNTETIKAMSKAGYSHNEIRQANFSLKSQMAAGTISSAKGAKDAGYGLATVVNNGLVDSIKEAQNAGYNMTQVYRSRKFNWADIEKYYGKNADRILTDTRAKRVAGSIKNDKDHGGWGNTKTKQYENLKKVFGPNNASFIWAYVKNNDVLFTKGAYTYAKMAKRNWQKFATGGFADFTGPAWLDGTPSKPEAVLNAADTKNFVQLRDILSSVMKGGAFDGPAYAAAGNTNFEININVDHIANDYDVDRIADRVKKQIVESSQYRNVNQVRRLR